MIARYSGAVGISVGITFMLFFLMQLLVATGEDPFESITSSGPIDITMDARDESIRRKDRNKPQKQNVKPPPPPKFQQIQSLRPQNRNLDNSLTAFATDVNINAKIDLGAAPSDRDIQPIVRIPPQYPRRAAERGLEGYVDLRFSISVAGGVINPVVIFSTSSIFNRAAIRAVEKWKYNPKIVDGAAEERHGVEVRITFELEN